MKCMCVGNPGNEAVIVLHKNFYKIIALSKDVMSE